MGGGSGALQRLDRCRHMNGVQKAHRHWLSACNVVKARTSGTFTLHPLERVCQGPQLLQIPLPQPRELPLLASPASTVRSARLSAYYLELRTPSGRDRDLATPRVLVVAADELADTGAAHQPNWLIDTTPETTTFQDAALVVGAPFQDPDPRGPRFTLLSLDTNRAVVRVELAQSASEAPGTATCLDGSSFTDRGGDACLVSKEPDGGNGTSATLAAGPKTAGCCLGDSGPAAGGALPPFLILGMVLRRASGALPRRREPRPVSPTRYPAS
jgi:hypothetical protein